MAKWAGWIITLAGAGHTVGSLIETVPAHLGTWFDGQLWSETTYTALSEAGVAFWYSAFSFGPPLLLVGVTVLWLDRRGITPPEFIGWAIAAWVVLTFAATGPSPLLLLLIAATLLIIEARGSSRRAIGRTASTGQLSTAA
ncbi:DUF6463 family protein [Microbacterium sp.]|uniref:DUF6463 family protein n=1 Tax=Microbacterium sp. TaxID=51671 RepID=UPI00281157E6|nr:DUF6463 family protein [Microbacterium sp.]